MNQLQKIPDGLRDRRRAATPSVPGDAARILESITDAFFALDHEWRFTYVNAQAERLLRRTRDELLGKSIWDEFPEAVGSVSQRGYERAVGEQVTVTLEDYYAPLDTWFENYLYPSPEGLSVYFRDVNARKQSEAALRESEGRLRDAQARLEAALAAGGIATWAWDLISERIVADDNLARLFSLAPEDATDGRLDVYLQAIHPDDRSRVTQAIEEAVQGGDVYEVEYRIALSDGAHRWLASRGRVERDAAGRAVALPGVAVDITERVERERRGRFLGGLAERARRLTDPDAVISDALRSVGEFLGAARCVFVDIDVESDVCVCHPDFRAHNGVVSMAGAFPISDFGPVAAEYAAGRVVVVEDVRADPAQVPPENVGTYDAVGIRAHVGVPVVHSDRLVSCIGVHSDVPRHWPPEEVELLQTVVERTWLTVEVIRQERALIREAEEQREARARTARILESIADAFIAFDTEWRITYVNGEATNLLRRSQEELLGRVFWDEFPEVRGSVFEPLYDRAMREGVADSVEDYYAPLGKWFEVRASPSPDGISVFFQNITERKMMEAERARLAEREHNIAARLQESLQPSLPGTVPGLALARYYEAALAEAGVGGDFYDVFALEKGCTALVVGDLSGKGLAAAAQVATVRNMLRYAILRGATLAGAVTELNAVLADNGLLTGFCTLFIGAFDSGARTLTYVNCGQEPALVRRAAGGPVEYLPPTGSVLGSFAGAAFEEETVTLKPGDALAVFTDGLTEVGRSRLEMLDVSGVADLLARAPASSAEDIARHLIAGVDAAGQDGVQRDDVCLLVGVVE